MRFIRTGEDTAIFEKDGHRIRRHRGWFRLGGWQYLFHCSCGWQGQSAGCGAGSTNYEAAKHMRKVGDAR